MSSRSVVEIGHDIARSVKMEELPEIEPPQGTVEDREDDESSIEALQWVDFDEEEMELAKKLAAEEFPETTVKNQNIPSDAGVNEIAESYNKEGSVASSTGTEEDKISVIINTVEEEKEDGDEFEFPSDDRDVDIEDVGVDGDEEDAEDGDNLLGDATANTDSSYLTADGHGNYVPCRSSGGSEDKASTAPVLDDGPIWSSGPKMYTFQENRTFNQKLTFGVLISVVLAVGIGVGNLVAYNEYESDSFRPVEQFQCSGPIQDPRTSSEETSHVRMHHGFPSSTVIKSNIDVPDNDAHVPKKLLETYNRQTETLAYVVQSIDKLSKKFDQFENATKQLSGIVIMKEEGRKYGKDYRIDRLKKTGKLDVQSSQFVDVLQPASAKRSDPAEAKITEHNAPVLDEVTIISENVEPPKNLESVPNVPTRVDLKKKPASGSTVQGSLPDASNENARSSASVGPKLQEDFTFAIPQAHKPHRHYPPKSKLTRQQGIDIPDEIQGSMHIKGENSLYKIHKEKRKVKINEDRSKEETLPEKIGREKTPQREYKLREESPQREYKLKEQSIRNPRQRGNSPEPELQPSKEFASQQYKAKEAGHERHNKSKVKSPRRGNLPREKSMESEYKPRDNKPLTDPNFKKQRPKTDTVVEKQYPSLEQTIQESTPLPTMPKKVRKDKRKKTKERVEDIRSYDQARMVEPDDRKRNKKIKKYEDKENKKYSKYASNSQIINQKTIVKQDSIEEEFDWHSYRAQTRENRRLHQHWKNEFERNNWQLERDRAREKFRKGGDDQPNNFHKEFNSRTRIR